MMQMLLKAYLESIRPSKNDQKRFYADFAFLGGSASFLIPAGDVAFYTGQEGKQLDVLVSLRPRSVVLFDRPVTLFEPVSLVSKTGVK